MLSGLSRSGRSKAAWCIALAYLFCILAPGLSFALGGGDRPAPCIVEDHGPGMHRHQQPLDMTAAPLDHAGHAHGTAMHEGAAHDPSSHMMLADGALATLHQAAAADEATAPVTHSPKAADTRCCGLISLSAIPASAIVLVKPSAQPTLCETEGCHAIADNAPPRLYRPPIS